MRPGLLALTVLTLAVPTFAQRSHGGANQQPDQQPDQPITLHTGVRLVLVDVVVTDKNNQAIHGLKAADFSLLENNTSQVFKNFEEHVAPTAADLQKAASVPKLPPGVYSNFVAAQVSGPLNVVLLDRLNTPLDSQQLMQKQINEFLAAAKPGTHMAIFGLTDHLSMLQGFTDDPAMLKAVVDKNGNLRASVLLDNPNGNEAVMHTSDQYQSAMEELTDADTLAMMQDFETRELSFQSQLRVKYTLDGLNQLARYLATFPGRKNLIWFSGSFPVNILPDQTQTGFTQFAGTASSEKEFRETTALLSRNQVAVYPVYAKGLDVDAMFTAAADDSNMARARGAGGIRAALNQSSQNRYDEHSTMYMMADDTGGKAAVSTNDLKGAIESALSDGANYYTIAYTPTNATWDGKFRSISVVLQKQGYKLSYRRGYFADDVDPLGNLTASAAITSRSMRIALVHGGPVPTQVLFSTRVQPVSAVAENDPAPRNNADKSTKGPYHRYRVDYAIDPREIHFTQGPDGNRHETLEFVTYVFNPDGKLMNSTGNTIKTTVTPEQYELFQKAGIPYHQEISVPVKGSYSIRVAMHDVEADQVGAVELPVASVAHLKPLEAAAATPAGK